MNIQNLKIKLKSRQKALTVLRPVRFCYWLYGHLCGYIYTPTWSGKTFMTVSSSLRFTLPFSKTNTSSLVVHIHLFNSILVSSTLCFGTYAVKCFSRTLLAAALLLTGKWMRCYINILILGKMDGEEKEEVLGLEWHSTGVVYCWELHESSRRGKLSRSRA